MNENLLYAESHEWILIEGDTGTVGISDHAQAELTDIVFAEPPAVGKILAAGEVAAVVESVKAASDIYSPVSGEVIERNAAVEENPALLNTDPFGAGWIYKIRLSNPAEAAALKDPAAYSAQIGA
ncbi:MAG: glycine cleavage system protein GcvH [Verrucomicrobia bacterium]|nr:glycine cleavage system protein GcvH [Verrucomicrobiota bacterium]